MEITREKIISSFTIEELKNPITLDSVIEKLVQCNEQRAELIDL